MTDAPQIDDCRRFKELWKELVLARTAVPLVVVIPSMWLVAVGVWVDSNALIIGPLIELAVFMLIFPAVVAKRGKNVHTAVAAGGGGAALIALIGCALFETGQDGIPVLLYCMGAGMGLAEGWLEKSVATMYLGLVGGALSGAAAAKILAPVFDRWNAVAAIGLSALAAVCLHLGIGLSLALGRWIRDLPKRRAAS